MCSTMKQVFFFCIVVSCQIVLIQILWDFQIKFNYKVCYNWEGGRLELWLHIFNVVHLHFVCKIYEICVHNEN